VLNTSNPIAALLARSDLSPGVRAFLADLARRAARRPLTPRQMRAVERIANTPPRPDYDAINRAARQRAEDVCRRLLPGGVRRGAEWACGSLSGEAGQSLRVRLVGERAGAWIDFDAGDRGGDFVSLAAAVVKVSQAEAARGLARMLGVEDAADVR
jgi:hypothetical protein